MSKPQKSGEKLLSTVLQKFPLANEWESIGTEHYEIKSLFCMTFCFLGIILGGLCLAAVGSGFYTSFPFSGVNKTLFFILSGLVGSIMGGGMIYCALKGIVYNLSPKKQRKHLRSNKPAVRDYLAQKKAVRLVATLVPEFSTSDLKLLQSHPQFNTVFQKVFERELKKREEIQIVNNVNVRFTENYVNVQIEEPVDIFCVEKNNPFISTTSKVVNT